LPTTPRAELLGDRQDEIGRRRPFGQLADELEADDLRHEHRDRLAEHRRLGLDPADPPAKHAEPVDHRRVRIGADERVGIERARLLVKEDDAREIFKIDLMNDAGPWRYDAEVLQGALPPAQQRVSLSVALILQLDVDVERADRAESVYLDGVVDHEVNG